MPLNSFTFTTTPLFANDILTEPVSPLVVASPKRGKVLNTKIGSIYKYKPLSKYEGLTGKIPVVAPFIYVGIEIELEEVKLKQTLNSSVWHVEEDGSLKNRGKEFITRPIKIKYLERELETLFSCISAEKSSRCSLHVHINSRDMTLEELNVFLLLYLMFEKHLYRLSGYRSNNNFCVPLYENSSLVRRFIGNLKDGHISEEWYKYSGLNLSPIFGGGSSEIGKPRTGTIEFRHHKGTKSIEEIMCWLNIISCLKIAAKKIKIKDLEESLWHLRTTSAYEWITTLVFGKYSERLFNLDSFVTELEDGISVAKLCILPEEKPDSFIIIGIPNSFKKGGV